MSGLNRLSEEALQLVQTDVLPEQVGAAVGASTEDAAKQNAIIKSLLNNKDIETYKSAYNYAIRALEMMQAKTNQDTLTGDLFGDDAAFQSEMDILADVMRIENALVRMAKNKYKEVFNPLDVKIREGEYIDVEGRKAEAAELGPSVTAAGSKAELVLSRVPEVKEYVRQAATRVASGASDVASETAAYAADFLNWLRKSTGEISRAGSEHDQAVDQRVGGGGVSADTGPSQEMGSSGLQVPGSATGDSGGVDTQSGALFSIIGERGANENRQKNLAIAKKMLQAGKDAKTIWLATGWERGQDGKWRSEIDSAQMTLKGTDQMYGSDTLGGLPSRRLQDYINYPELFSTYPDMADIRTKVVTESSLAPNASQGAYVFQAGLFDNYDPKPSMNSGENILVFASTPDIARRLLLHEIQHAVQKREGFAQGGSPLGSNFEKYKWMPGEVEARNVARRSSLSPEERAQRPPSATQEQAPRFSVAPPVDSPAFKAWFGDSKAVDRNGNPLPVYHGTHEEFTVFKTGLTDDGEKTVWDESHLGESIGIYLTPDIKIARSYGPPMKLYLKAERPLDLYSKEGQDAALRILADTGNISHDDVHKPKSRTAIKHVWMRSDIMHKFLGRHLDPSLTMNILVENAKEYGYDSIILPDTNLHGDTVGKTFIAIDPTQVKSATENVGTYDPENPDIRFAVRAAGRDFEHNKRPAPAMVDYLEARMDALDKALPKVFDGLIFLTEKSRQSEAYYIDVSDSKDPERFAPFTISIRNHDNMGDSQYDEVLWLSDDKYNNWNDLKQDVFRVVEERTGQKPAKTAPPRPPKPKAGERWLVEDWPTASEATIIRVSDRRPFVDFGDGRRLEVPASRLIKPLDTDPENPRFAVRREDVLPGLELIEDPETRRGCSHGSKPPKLPSKVGLAQFGRGPG